MELTPVRWVKERRYLQVAIAAAGYKDRQGLLAEAFRRAFAWLGKHPAEIKPDDIQVAVTS